MYDHNQIDVPPSFVALYCRNDRLLKSRAYIEQRHDACDDLAQQLSVFCSRVKVHEDLSETEVLQRCRAGLLDVQDAHAGEIGWVIGRIAELLDWPASAVAVVSDVTPES